MFITHLNNFCCSNCIPKMFHNIKTIKISRNYKIGIDLTGS